MNNSILVDTNILIYAIDEDSKFHHSASKLLLDSNLNIFTTSKNITEFLVVLTRHSDIHLSIKDCLEILESLLENLIVLYPIPKTTKVFYELLKKYNPRGLWIHDVEIASIAIAYGILTIATNNVADFIRIKELTVKEIQ